MSFLYLSAKVHQHACVMPPRGMGIILRQSYHKYLGSECLIGRVDEQTAHNIDVVLLSGHVESRETVLNKQ